MTEIMDGEREGEREREREAKLMDERVGSRLIE